MKEFEKIRNFDASASYNNYSFDGKKLTQKTVVVYSEVTKININRKALLEQGLIKSISTVLGFNL